MKSKEKFDHVLELIFAGLSFRQISEVVQNDCKNLFVAARNGTVSSGEGRYLSQMSCAIGIQAPSAILKKISPFAMGSDESNNGGQDAYLNYRNIFLLWLGLKERLKFTAVSS